jgi:hypothetical protein
VAYKIKVCKLFKRRQLFLIGMDYVVVRDAKDARKRSGKKKILKSAPYKTMRYCVEKNLVEGLLMAELDDKLASAMARNRVAYYVDMGMLRKKPSFLGSLIKVIKLCKKFKVEVRLSEKDGVDDDISVSLFVCLGLEKKDAKVAVK